MTDTVDVCVICGAIMDYDAPRDAAGNPIPPCPYPVNNDHLPVTIERPDETKEND